MGRGKRRAGAAGVSAEHLRVYDWLGCIFEEAP